MTAFNIKVVSDGHIARLYLNQSSSDPEWGKNYEGDTVCPWCFVGHRQLEEAINLWHKKHPDSTDTFNVEFFPYQLMPEFPRGSGQSTDKQTLYNAKFGAVQRQQISQRLTAIGAPLGINFRWGGKVGNTRDSHRLIELAKKYGSKVQQKTVDGIFSAYFEHEKDITMHQVLGEIAKSAGIPEGDFKKAIVESDEYGAQVDKFVAEVRANSVQGVPDFTIQDKFKLSGARDSEAFISLLERVKQMNQ